MLSLVPYYLLTTLWSDAEFTGRLSIKLPSDWQILSLLKSANAGPGSETEDAVDLFPRTVRFPVELSVSSLDRPAARAWAPLR